MSDDFPNLTLTPQLEEVGQNVELVKQAPPEQLDPEAQKLTEQELAIVRDFAKQIDITNTTQVLQYGASAQKGIDEFAQRTLDSVRTKDTGEVGKIMTDLILELQGFSAEEKPGPFSKLFGNTKNQITAMKAKYDKVEVNVEKVVENLEHHQITMLKDVAGLDQLYEHNLKYFKELTMYIAAGKMKLNETRSVDLVELENKAKQSQDTLDAQSTRDLADKCDRFEKKIHDLELTRNISLQMGPQIRLIQNNDSLMVEKIQSLLVNTIPLWKSEMVLGLGLAHSTEAIKAARAVSDATNEMLKRRAETLKMGTIEAARESERGIVDIETLQQTNKALIETLDEVKKIQDEGRVKRREAEKSLTQIEDELKQKLLSMR